MIQVIIYCSRHPCQPVIFPGAFPPSGRLCTGLKRASAGPCGCSFPIRLHGPGGHHVHAGAQHVGDHHVPGVYRGRQMHPAQRPGHIQHPFLGYVSPGTDRHHRQQATGDPDGAGNGAGRMGTLLPGVGVPPGTGVAGDLRHPAAVHNSGQLAAHRAADTRQLADAHFATSST